MLCRFECKYRNTNFKKESGTQLLTFWTFLIFLSGSRNAANKPIEAIEFNDK